jgi:hypothetical protein
MIRCGAGKQLKIMKQIEKPDFNTRMKREMKSLQRNIKATEKAYGESLFTLTVARSYIKKLLGNAKNHFIHEGESSRHFFRVQCHCEGGGFLAG